MALNLSISSRSIRLAAGRRFGGLTSVKLRHYAFMTRNGPQGVVLRRGEGNHAIETTLPKIWLRDNCRCKQCVNQDTMQRNFNTFEIPNNIEPTTLLDTEKGIDITWSDSHKSHYPWTWLQKITAPAQDDLITEKSGKQLWGISIESHPPEVSFDDVMGPNSSGMSRLTDHIRVYGFCFVTETPATPEASEKVLSSLGPIRNTHYGGFYDFVPDLALADTAYTNLALAAHTDNTYFTEPAGLQSFHLLSHTPPPNQKPGDALGGQSLLVDGFNVANILKAESPDDYECLKSVKIPWHASGNQDVAIAPDMAYPVIEEDSTLHRIRWNNDDRGVVPLDVDAAAWYRAARKWHEILTRTQSEYWFQLQPGRLLIFDNWRVLHGRSAFEGLRRICGGYINRDDFVSRWKISNYPREKVIASNMQTK